MTVKMKFWANGLGAGRLQPTRQWAWGLLAAALLAMTLSLHPAAAQTAATDEPPPSAPSPAPSTAEESPAEQLPPPPAPSAAELEAAAAEAAAAETQPAQTQPAEPGDLRPRASRPAVKPASSSAPVLPDPVTGPLLLNFQEAPVASVLEYLSEAAGMVIVQESRVEGRITVVSRQPVSLDEAVELLDSVLITRGHALVRNGRTLKIVAVDKAQRELIPVRSGNDPNRIGVSDRVITQVIPIRYADAVRLKTDLASVVPDGADLAANAASNSLILTSTEANIRRVVEIISAIDVHLSEVQQVRVFQLKFANAASAARLITDIFRTDNAPGGTTGGTALANLRRFVRGGPGGGPGGGAQGQSEEQGSRAVKVTASSDDRTNTLVVSAPPDLLKVIGEVVAELDANPAEQQAVFIYSVRNGQAANIASVLNNLFGWSTSTAGSRTTGASTTNNINRGGSAFGSRTGGMGTTGGTGGRGTGGGTGTGTSRNGGTTGGGRAGTTGGARAPSAGTAAAASDLAGQVYIVADADTNSLLVTASSANFPRVKSILEDLDRPVPQVLIKVLIAEVTHTNGLDLGAEFSGFNLRASGNGQSGGTGFLGVSPGLVPTPSKSALGSGQGISFTLLEENASIALRALAQTTKLDVLSRPYILTSDNQQATILVGQEVPFITNTRITDTGQTINTIEYDDIGIILNVTPHINPQGLVTLDVYPEISALTGDRVNISDTVTAPVFAKRSAQSRVAVRDGQTIVIGGLMEDRITESVDKVPLLGDIPLVGALFRHTVKNKSKTELLIFLTPHVAEAPEELAGMSKDEAAGTKLVPGAVGKGVYQEHMQGLQRGAASRPAEHAETDGQEPPVRQIPPRMVQPPAGQDSPATEGAPESAPQSAPETQAAPPAGESRPAQQDEHVVRFGPEVSDETSN